MLPITPTYQKGSVLTKASKGVSNWQIPSKHIYNYALNIKNNYPDVWKLGGNEFGNQAFKNLERVIQRGSWTKAERWFFIKWQSFAERHKHDFRINGLIACLKWLVVVDKGWEYQKSIIEKEIKKRYPEYTKAEQGAIIQDVSQGEMIEGKRHSEGGTPLRVGQNVIAEAEVGEIIINRKSSATHCEELSEINQREGGVPLDCDKIRKTNTETESPKMLYGGEIAGNKKGVEEYFKGFDGNKRFEIVDTQYILSSNFINHLSRSNQLRILRLKDVIEHNRLFYYYPEFKEITVKISSLEDYAKTHTVPMESFESGVVGALDWIQIRNPNTYVIIIYLSHENRTKLRRFSSSFPDNMGNEKQTVFNAIASSILAEMQHAIQCYEFGQTEFGLDGGVRKVQTRIEEIRNRLVNVEENSTEYYSIITSLTFIEKNKEKLAMQFYLDDPYEIESREVVQKIFPELFGEEPKYNIHKIDRAEIYKNTSMENKESILKQLEEKKQELLLNGKELSDLRKKLYGNVDISSPKSQEEKDLDKQISDVFSQINEIVFEKKRIKSNKMETGGELIEGGLSDNMTIKEIADLHGVSVEEIKSQLSKGVKVEKEHTNNNKIATEIAKDHLVENPDYYDRLSLAVLKGGGFLEPHKEVKASQAEAIREVISNIPRFEKLTEMEAGMLYGLRDKNLNDELYDVGGKEKTLKNTIYNNLIEKYYIDQDWNDGYSFNELAKDFIDTVNNRLQTRKQVKSGTDLFPEDANIKEFKELNEPVDQSNYIIKTSVGDIDLRSDINSEKHKSKAEQLTPTDHEKLSHAHENMIKVVSDSERKDYHKEMAQYHSKKSNKKESKASSKEEKSVKSKNTVDLIKEASKMGTKYVKVKFVPAYDERLHASLKNQELKESLKTSKEEIFDITKEDMSSLFNNQDVVSIKWHYSGGSKQLKEFEQIVNESSSFEEAYKNAKQIKGVSSDVSDYFHETYGEKGNISQEQAFKKYYNEIKQKNMEKKPKKGLKKLAALKVAKLTKKDARKFVRTKRSKHAIAVDKGVKAKKAGWRLSKNGNWYKEMRPNRSDVDRRKKI